ncbi:uncharacterized protein C8orf74 homolog isoform X2 [Gymnodraco acuticeps]|uniref:Uncharacterized protein C8orf74 homolog isoform X2 n=1 Tax=Gymnodraco acuticeps TaxID=8218 RepID=A0A6P8SVL4_GYMAC|nr:uncharacterized protein C8orf74 homolog isoform X2 [Gymnodraco acuticeps]XP_034051672.1 uncharacterized protein C8orf74 homolog isoform X2 [Gymnodraco acuticeps]
MMESLTESEISQIARHQRDAGVQRLSRHFSWLELSDERRLFHQEFVFDVAMFAASCGFSWTDVIRAAVIAKGIFPRLEGLDVPNLLSLLRDELSEYLPNLTPLHQLDFTQFLTHTLTARRRLFQAAMSGASNMSIAQLHLEVQVPPTPCPLAQGTDLHVWEHQRHREALTSMLRQKEEKLRSLRKGSRVTLGEVDIPQDVQLDNEGVQALVRAAVKATEGQMLESLNREASLLVDILKFKLQQAAADKQRLHPHSAAKANAGLKDSGNAL